MSKPLKIVCFLFLLLVALSSSILAQAKFANAIRLTTDEGLVDNHVNDIVEGKHGFIWIGTGNGISRFDGSYMKNYQHDPEQSNSLLYNGISKMLATKDYIWIANGLGISALDIQADTFVNYIYNRKGDRFDTIPRDHLQMTTIYQDQRGDIWCGTRYSGFGKYNREKDGFDFFQYKGKEPSGIDNFHFAISIEEDTFNDSIMWVGTVSGLLKYNRLSQDIDLFFFPHTDKEIERGKNNFRKLYQHSDGLIYCGNWFDTTYIFDPGKGTLLPLPLHSDETLKISGAYNFTRKSDKEIWITTGEGIYCYHSDTHKISFSKKNTVKRNKYYGINLLDKKGRIWFREHNGVYLYDPALQQFAIKSYIHIDSESESWGFARQTISIDSGNELVVCAQGTKGMYHLNRTTEKWTETPIPDKYYEARYPQVDMRSMTKSPWYDYTICTPEKLFTYNAITRQVKDFPFQPDLPFKSMHRILWDVKDQLWIGTKYDGLIRWNSKTGAVKNFQLDLGAGGEVRVTQLFEDSKHNIWMKRIQGFSVYIVSQDTMLNFLHPVHKNNPFTRVDYFTEDNQGRIWISGPKGFVGFGKVENPDRGVIRQFDLKTFDPSIKWFAGMKADANGDIWLLSNNNLIKLDTDSFQCELYSFDYGIKDREFFSFDFLETGEMVIGLREGIVVVDPKNLQKNKELPQPYVTQINILDKEYEGDTSELMLTSLPLKYWENFFSFDFSAKGFTLPEGIQYRYRLKNFKEEWTDAKERRNANYTNVPGGEYVFQVQAANNEGVWNEEIYELNVSVGIPWWQSWWFRLVTFLLLSGAVFSVYRYRVLEVKREERLKSDFEKQLANVEMNALRAQMNPHFLFNCLNSIDSYIIKNETKKASEYLNKFARLIRLILQNSRSNYVNLKDELESLELYMSMESLRFRNKFDYEIKIENSLEVESIDIPPMLIQPYIENAIWHGLMHIRDDHKGKVILAIGKENGTLKCIIEDNGIGRERSAEIKKSKSVNRKKSMGMRITQDRIEMINKLYDSKTSVVVVDMKDENGVASGTKVELNIPV